MVASARRPSGSTTKPYYLHTQFSTLTPLAFRECRSKHLLETAEVGSRTMSQVV